MNGNRRHFLKLGLLTAASTSSPACANRGIQSFPRLTSSSLSSAASCCGARGWAAWENGRLITSVNPSTAGPSLSITKTLAGLAISRATSEGWLDPSERAAATISEWVDDPRKEQITVRMLLQQVSGLEAGVIPLYRAHPAHKGRAAVALHCVDEPGTVFHYGPSHWELLGEILRRKLASRGQTLRGFLNQSVLYPIGLKTANWRSDSAGNPYLSTGAELSITSLGKLGLTISRLLTGENADGFSAAAYQNIVHPSDANPMFGGGLWHNRNASRFGARSIEVEKHLDDPLSSSFWHRACLSTRHPSELVALIGSGGKRLYLWPSRRLVVARLGGSDFWSDQRFLSAI